MRNVYATTVIVEHVEYLRICLRIFQVNGVSYEHL